MSGPLPNKKFGLLSYKIIRNFQYPPYLVKLLLSVINFFAATDIKKFNYILDTLNLYRLSLSTIMPPFNLSVKMFQEQTNEDNPGKFPSLLHV